MFRAGFGRAGLSCLESRCRTSWSSFLTLSVSSRCLFGGVHGLGCQTRMRSDGIGCMQVTGWIDRASMQMMTLVGRQLPFTRKKWRDPTSTRLCAHLSFDSGELELLGASTSFHRLSGSLSLSTHPREDTYAPHAPLVIGPGDQVLCVSPRSSTHTRGLGPCIHHHLP